MKLVGIGGGHGLSNALSAMRLLGHAPTAVVTVADDGGSSGRLREEHGVVALGDLRMALFTLATDDRLAPLLQHRFAEGELQGHALGNLFLLALLERHDGDVVQALDEAAALLRCQGRVLPATTERVHLWGCVAGQEVGGQVRVATADGPIEKVWLDPARPAACEEAVAAIAAADAVVLGPGSLFTSILAALLVPGIAAAVANAQRVIVPGNVLAQPGEAGEFDTRAHIDALVAHVPDLVIDTLLLHDGPHAKGMGRPLQGVDAHPAVRTIARHDLIARHPDGTPEATHDPKRLAVALDAILG